MQTITVEEAKAMDFELIERVLAGESFIITVAGVPKLLAQPVPGREGAADNDA